MYPDWHFVTICVLVANKYAMSQPSLAPSSDALPSDANKKQNKKISAVLLTVNWSPLFTFLILSNFFWCFLLHFYLSSKTPHPSPTSLPTTLHHFRSGCQSALLIFKDPRAWNADSEHRPDFQSLISLSRFPLEEDCFVFSPSHFLLAGRTNTQQSIGGL